VLDCGVDLIFYLYLITNCKFLMLFLFKYVFSLVKFILYHLKHCLHIVLSHNLILSSSISHTFLLNQYIISHWFGCWKIFYIYNVIRKYLFCFIWIVYSLIFFFFWCWYHAINNYQVLWDALFYKLICLVLKKKSSLWSLNWFKKEMWIMNIFLTKECE